MCVQARQRMQVLPGLQPEDTRSLAHCLDPALQPGVDINSLAMRKLGRDSISMLYVSLSQTEFAAECVLPLSSHI